LRHSKIIPSHWIPPFAYPLHSSTSSSYTAISLLRLALTKRSTTSTRSRPVLDLQSHLESLSTVPVFPGRLRRLVLPPPQHSTSVQVAVIPRSTPALPLPPRTTRRTSCLTVPSTPPSSPPWTTPLPGTPLTPCPFPRHSPTQPSALSHSPPQSRHAPLSPSSMATTRLTPMRYEPSREASLLPSNSAMRTTLSKCHRRLDCNTRRR
jgi:hypothetical protein